MTNSISDVTRSIFRFCGHVAGNTVFLLPAEDAL